MMKQIEQYKEKNTNQNCKKCEYLMELFQHTPQTNRDYWVMTELFVFLHDGKDICKGKTD